MFEARAHGEVLTCGHVDMWLGDATNEGQSSNFMIFHHMNHMALAAIGWTLAPQEGGTRRDQYDYWRYLSTESRLCVHVLMIGGWLAVWNFFIFIFYLALINPNLLSYFLRGVETTNQMMIHAAPMMTDPCCCARFARLKPSGNLGWWGTAFLTPKSAISKSWFRYTSKTLPTGAGTNMTLAGKLPPLCFSLWRKPCIPMEVIMLLSTGPDSAATSERWRRYSGPRLSWASKKRLPRRLWSGNGWNEKWRAPINFNQKWCLDHSKYVLLPSPLRK